MIGVEDPKGLLKCTEYVEFAAGAEVGGRGAAPVEFGTRCANVLQVARSDLRSS